jgi:carbon monoxide dehydrogenase subunit G
MPVFEERFEVKAPIDAVWAFLLDPARLASCIPGCGAVEIGDDRTYRVAVSVRVGFLSTTQDMRMTIVEAEPLRRLVAAGRGEDRRLASQVDVRTTLELEPLGPNATALRYQSEVKVLGRLGSIGDAVMRAKAGELAREFAARVQAAITGQA